MHAKREDTTGRSRTKLSEPNRTWNRKLHPAKERPKRKKLAVRDRVFLLLQPFESSIVHFTWVISCISPSWPVLVDVSCEAISLDFFFVRLLRPRKQKRESTIRRKKLVNFLTFCALNQFGRDGERARRKEKVSQISAVWKKCPGIGKNRPSREDQRKKIRVSAIFPNQS